MNRKILSVFLAVCMILTSVPITATAQENTNEVLSAPVETATGSAITYADDQSTEFRYTDIEPSTQSVSYSTGDLDSGGFYNLTENWDTSNTSLGSGAESWYIGGSGEDYSTSELNISGDIHIILDGTLTLDSIRIHESSCLYIHSLDTDKPAKVIVNGSVYLGGSSGIKLIGVNTKLNKLERATLGFSYLYVIGGSLNISDSGDIVLFVYGDAFVSLDKIDNPEEAKNTWEGVVQNRAVDPFRPIIFGDNNITVNCNTVLDFGVDILVDSDYTFTANEGYILELDAMVHFRVYGTFNNNGVIKINDSLVYILRFEDGQCYNNGTIINIVGANLDDSLKDLPEINLDYFVFEPRGLVENIVEYYVITDLTPLGAEQTVLRFPNEYNGLPVIVEKLDYETCQEMYIPDSMTLVAGFNLKAENSVMHLPASVKLVENIKVGRIDVDRNSMNLNSLADGKVITDANNSILYWSSADAVTSDIPTSIGEIYINSLGNADIIIPRFVHTIDKEPYAKGVEVTECHIDPDNADYYAINDCLVSRHGDALIYSGQCNVIPEGVKVIANDAFSGVDSIEELVLPASLEGIDGSVFMDGYRRIPVQNIRVVDGNPIFDSRDNCNAIIKTATNTIVVGSYNMTIPEGIVGADPKGFTDRVKKLYVPSTYTSNDFPMTIETEIVVAEGNTVYDSRDNCNALIRTVDNTLIRGCSSTVIPNTVTAIDFAAFRNIDITDITIPGSITVIPSFSFYNCTELENIILEEGIKTIRPLAFDSCTVENLVIPKSAENIDTTLFGDDRISFTIYTDNPIVETLNWSYYDVTIKPLAPSVPESITCELSSTADGVVIPVTYETGDIDSLLVTEVGVGNAGFPVEFTFENGNIIIPWSELAELPTDTEIYCIISFDGYSSVETEFLIDPALMFYNIQEKYNDVRFTMDNETGIASFYTYEALRPVDTAVVARDAEQYSAIVNEFDEYKADLIAKRKIWEKDATDGIANMPGFFSTVESILEAYSIADNYLIAMKEDVVAMQERYFDIKTRAQALIDKKTAIENFVPELTGEVNDKVYDGKPMTFNFSVIPPVEDKDYIIPLTYTITDANDKAVSTTDTIPVGEYKVKIELIDNDYPYASWEKPFTVTKAPLTITTPNLTVKESEIPSKFEVVYEGFVNGETASVLDGVVNITVSPASTALGNNVLNVTAEVTGDCNYEITTKNATLTVVADDAPPSGGGGSWYPTVPDTPKEPEKSEKPFIKGDNGKEGWDVITDQTETAKDGDTIIVDMNGTTTVPKDVIESIKGKDVDIVFDMGNGMTWTVNGKDITGSSLADINFGITSGTVNIPVDVVNKVTGEKYSMNITLEHSGEFGFTAVLTVNMEKKNSGLFANLFYYNEKAKKLEFVCADEIDKDGNAKLTFTHASEYTIVIDKEPMGITEEEKQSARKNLNKPIKAGKNYNTLSWGKVDGADGYIIYTAPCNTKGKTYKLKKVKTITSGDVTSYKHKSLKENTFYKYKISAYKLVGDEKVVIGSSVGLHSQTGSKNTANPTAITVDKNEFILKKDKTAKITAKISLPKGKKVKAHAGLRYVVVDSSVASVSSSGKIKAKKTGSTAVYVVAQNGVSKKVTITVK